MLSSEDLYKLAKARFEEAEILLKNKKPDGAVHLAGYAIELMLKRRIVHVLDWDGYPDTKPEFERKQSFKIHDLSNLLHLSGLEKKLQADNGLFAKWQIAGAWDSEVRYKKLGQVSQSEARDIINATRDVLNCILAENRAHKK